MNNPSVLGLATLIGAIVGAGIFGLPYAMVQSGLLASLFYFILLGVCVTYLHLFFGEVCLRTPGKHRLIGYANLYLGSWGRKLVTFSTVAGSVGALLAFLIIGGDFLEIMLTPFISLSAPWHHFLFWLPLSLLVGAGIRLIAKIELITSIALFCIMGLMFSIALPHISFANIPLLPTGSPFLAFGVILFSLIGWSAIPEIAELFRVRQEKQRFDNLIVFASTASILLYAVFSFAVVGVSGRGVTPEGLAGLAPILGTNIVVLGALFGLVAVADSFLIMGSYLKNSLKRDYGVPGIVAIAITVFAPLALYLMGFQEFVFVLGAVGILVGVIEGSVITALFLRARRAGQLQPEYEVKVFSWVPVFILLLLIGGFLASLAFSF